MATVLAQSLPELPSRFQWQAGTAGGSVALLLLSWAETAPRDLFGVWRNLAAPWQWEHAGMRMLIACEQ